MRSTREVRGILADPYTESAALADLRALLPMVRHHVAMLSSPATAGQDANAGMELAALAETMATLCTGCGIADCAALLDALHAALAQAPKATEWSPPFAAAALEAFGYALHRIGALGIETVALAPDTNGQFAIAARLTLALERARRMGRTGRMKEQRSVMPEGAWGDDDALDALSSVFAESHELTGEIGRGESAEPATQLTEEERAMLASFPSAPLRVTMPPAPQVLSSDSPTASLPRAALAGSGWAPGPADVLDDAPGVPKEPASAPSQQADWRAPTAAELDEIPERMKRLFLVETEEDLQELRLALLRYEQRPDDPSALHAMAHVTHKIKGTAAMMGFDVLAAITHSYEDLLKALLTRRMEAGTHANAALLRGLVLLQASLDAANAGQVADAALASEAASLLTRLQNADGRNGSGGAPTPHSRASLDTPGKVPVVMRESTQPAPRGNDGELKLHVDVHRLDDLMRHLSALAVNRAALLQTRSDIMRLRSEMDAALARLSDLSTQMSDLQPLLRHASTSSRDGSGGWEHRTGFVPRAGISSKLDTGIARRGESRHVSDELRNPVWDELELDRSTALDTAFRALGEVVADVSATSRELRAALLRLSQVSEDQAGLAARMQRDVMHVRLVPLSDIKERLDFEVKVLSPMLGKSVEFSISGETTEIDRNVSEALAQPLLQLVRNAVVHGIESREERVESGKPATGSVWVHAYYMGSEVIIEVGDDGRGVNPHKLVGRAVMLRLLDGETARTLSPADALDLMFLPGLTTFEEPKELSGRGVGLDQVRTAIQKLKGVISVRSEQGKGSVFRIRVPISLSIVHALRVLAGGQSFAVPFTSVKRTLSLSASEILWSAPDAGDGAADSTTRPAARPPLRIRVERDDVPISNSEGTSAAYDEVPVYALATLLGLEHEPRNPQAALLVEVGRQCVALLVDGVFEEQELAVQTLPRPLQRRAVRGASVTTDGQVLLLLDLPELADGILDSSRALPPPRPRPVPRFAESLAPCVLVVDDSLTIRQTLEHTLKRGGFDVQLARDGIEALEMMLSRLPRVVVLDIEMPRLDGFDVLSIMHGSPHLRDVRVVMLTSRAGDKHKQHAASLGARAYLVKPCPQETLLETVRALLAEPAGDIPQNPGIQ